MIIDGKEIAQTILDHIKVSVSKLAYRQPGLAFVLVGDDSSSQTYIRMKKRRCAEVGFFSFDHTLPSNTTQGALIKLIHELNTNPSVDGILIQLPLPPHIDTQAIIEAIDPRKDVDGFHPLNLGKLLLGEADGFVPCTPQGIVHLLDASSIPIEGKHVVIVGRSNIVGKPLAALLMQKKKGANATVTLAHSGTTNLPEVCRSADILICAVGRPHFITADMVKEGAVVVDVGINHVGNKIIGDVDSENVHPKCLAITPVPGGVGPMTIAMLLANTLISYQRD